MLPTAYKLKVPLPVVNLIRTLHPHLKKKIRAGFDSITLNPLAGKALQQEFEGLRSFRVGKFRIVYKIADKKILEIIAIGPRKTIYAETYGFLIKEAHQRRVTQILDKVSFKKGFDPLKLRHHER